jgi:hypothetical protein
MRETRGTFPELLTFNIHSWKNPALLDYQVDVSLHFSQCLKQWTDVGSTKTLKPKSIFLAIIK